MFEEHGGRIDAVVPQLQLCLFVNISMSARIEFLHFHISLRQVVHEHIKMQNGRTEETDVNGWSKEWNARGPAGMRPWCNEHDRERTDG